ncbi:MAG: tRNA preQ1(34) S-adenosylmethionine ribosyltransferase-isomerase QueA [Prochloraceae cyanobacterium]|nr:tRNA preQ1(34) S-adenosylmethionine ribosyltransferase-isomerase QueA [Prochloraceae cyanobacterium]
MNPDCLLSNYDYQLPQELIAQDPVIPRDRSRLLAIDSPTTFTHSIFKDLPSWLLPGDLLVLNNTRVIPARLYGRKSTGANVEILLLEKQQKDDCWLALVKPGKRFKLGSEITFEPICDRLNFNIKAKAIAKDEATGGRILEFEIPSGYCFEEILDYFGKIPFPPYINRSQSQASQYQTVYAREWGSVAAPTAGLHFTKDLLATLTSKGIKQTYVTLHVGVGTFRPVEVEDITTHGMHSEWLEVPLETIELIKETKARGGRVIAVGTTVVRALEGAANKQEVLAPFYGKTDLFIYPGYRWKIVDGLITNFHLPRSSLLMLVSAMVGRDRLLSLYREAIEQKYRFYSFGDAMLILPEARIY